MKPTLYLETTVVSYLTARPTRDLIVATWNLKHINHPALADDLRRVCQGAGFHCPVICTPEELPAV